MRPALKRTAEALLAGSGLPRLGRRLGRRSAVVLAYHNVVPDGDRPTGERSLHLPLSRFRDQLDLLEACYEVRPLEALFDPSSSGRPRAAITFDDAYRGAVTLAIPELVARGLPATIFVAPAFVGGGTFWWDDFADPQLGTLQPALRARALTEWTGVDAVVRGALAPPASPALPRTHQCATEEELGRAATQPGIRLGAHSWNHANLTRLPSGELDDQLVRPLAWLRSRFAATIPWLSYPYGLATAAVARRAADHGYTGALLVDGGRCPIPPERGRQHLLPRLNVPAGLSRHGFELAAAGITR